MNGSERTALIPVLWKKGKEVSEICEELGYKDAKHVTKVLRRNGLYVDKRIDVAKVHALQKAGWNMEMIVNEFGYRYTAEEIQNAIRRGARK